MAGLGSGREPPLLLRRVAAGAGVVAEVGAEAPLRDVLTVALENE